MSSFENDQAIVFSIDKLSKLDEENQLLKKIISTNQLSEILKILCSLIYNQKLADGYYVAFPDKEEINLVVEKIVYNNEYDNMEELFLKNKMPLKTDNEYCICYEENKMIEIDNKNLNEYGESVNAFFKLWGLKSGVYLPITNHHHVLGVLFLFNKDKKMNFNKVNLLTKIMPLFYFQIKNLLKINYYKNSENSIKTADERNRRLWGIAGKINSLVSMDSIYEEILKELLNIFHFDIGITFVQKDKNLDYVYGHYNNKKYESIFNSVDAYFKLINGYKVKLEDGATSLSFIRNMHFYIPNIEKVLNMPMSPKDRKGVELFKTAKSLFIVPIRRMGKPIGIFQFWSLNEVVILSEFEIEIINSICSFLSTAISHAEFYTLIENQKRKLEEKKNIIEEKNSQFKKELEIARKIQDGLIPRKAPLFNGLKLATLYKPVDAIGGDFYNFLNLSDHLFGIFLSDVSGHGVPAALITTMIKAIIDTADEKVYIPKRLLTYINGKVISQTIEHFLTAFYCIFNNKTKILKYVRAGHNYPILVREGRTKELKSKGKILGYSRDLVFEEKSIQLKPGDKILFYTDGLTEALNKKGEEFDSILHQVLLENEDKKIEIFTENIFNRLIDFTENWVFSDDICMIGVHVDQ